MLVTTVVMASSVMVWAPAAVAEPQIGATVADFSLYDVHRRARSLGDFDDKSAFVVLFMGTECPLANLYVPKLIEMYREYEPKRVQFVAINANVQDSFTRVAGHAQRRGIPFPVLKDFDQKVAAAFGASRTPEVFLLDGKRRLRYRGRIDDQYTVTHKRNEARRHDLKNAIDELLADKPITRPQTIATGCLIPRAAKPRLTEKLTYAEHAGPIVQRRCQECHRPGEVGPFSLLTYDDAKHWSDTIHEVVREERMPPWHADPHFGKFANDRRLSPREREVLLAWIEQGCRKGLDANMPPPRQFPQGWSIGEPDVVFEMPQEQDVPATGVVDYRYIRLDPKFTEDVWVQRAEVRPGNRAVVHHVVVYVRAPGQRRLYGPDGAASLLVGWAPGDMPALFPTGVAKRIRAGSTFVFELHYTPNGTPQKDISKVGIVFAKKPPEREAQVNILAQMRIRIPPGTRNHKGQSRYTFTEDARILSLMPHMHLRGVRAEYEAAFPDGRTETLLSVPDYDFNWQNVYRFAEPVRVPKGTRITFTGYWDNSADNPRNPDASEEVRWGEQTWHEMLNGWVDFVPERRWDSPPPDEDVADSTDASR